MQDSTVTITVTAVDGATKTFQFVGDEAQKMGNKVAAAMAKSSDVANVAIKSTGGLEQATNKAASAHDNAAAAAKRSYLAHIGLTTILSAGVNQAFLQMVDVAGQAIQRVDLMANFPKSMEALGLSATDATAALGKLTDYIGQVGGNMQDATTSVTRFAEVTKNIKAATVEYVGVNNALIAGGAGADVQKNALEQLTQAYSRGKPQLIEWRSLMVAMPAQLNAVAQAMKFSNAQALGDALTHGTVSMQDFMTQLTKMATGTGPIVNQMYARMNGIQFAWTVFKNTLVQGMTAIISTIGRQNIISFLTLVTAVIKQLAVWAVDLISILMTLFNIISRLFGGPQLKLAKDDTAGVADNLGAAADNADGLNNGLDNAGKAAKTLQNQLAAFDKMNVLTSPSDSGSSGKGAGAGGGGVGGITPADASALNGLFDGLQSKITGISTTAKILAGILAGIAGIKFAQFLLGQFNGLVKTADDTVRAVGKVGDAIKKLGTALGIVDAEAAAGGIGGVGRDAEKLGAEAGSVEKMSKEVKTLDETMKGLAAITVLDSLPNDFELAARKFKGTFADMLGSFTGFGSKFTSGSKGLWTKVSTFFSEGLAGILGGFEALDASIASEGLLSTLGGVFATAAEGLGTLAAAIPPVAIVIAVVIGVIAALKDHWDQISKSVLNVTQQFTGLSGAFGNTGGAMSGLMGILAGAFHFLGDIFYPIIEIIIAAFDILVGVVKTVVVVISDVIGVLGKVPGLSGVSKVIGDIGKAFKDLGDWLANSAIPNITKFFDKITNTGPEGEYKRAVDAMTKASKDHSDALNKEKTAIDDVRNAQLALANAKVAVDEDVNSINDLTASLSGLTPGTHEYQTAADKLAAAQAQLAVDQKAVTDETKKTADAQKAASDAQKAVSDSSAKLLTAYDQLIDKNKSLSASAQTAAHDAGKGFIDTINDSLLNGAPKVQTAAQSIMNDINDVVKSNNPKIQAEASGLMVTMTAALKSNDPNVITAAKTTMDLYDKEIKDKNPTIALDTGNLVSTLSTTLASQDPTVRQRAIDTMNIYDSAMQSKNPNIQNTAANLVAILGNKLKDSNPDVVAKAQQTMDSIIQGMQSKDPAIRQKASDSYVQLRDQFNQNDMYGKGTLLADGIAQGTKDKATNNPTMNAAGQQFGKGMIQGIQSQWNNTKLNSGSIKANNQTFPITGMFPTLSWFARGGVIDQPTLSVLGEAGKEAVVPLENNLEWIDMLASKINGGGGGGGQPVQIVVQVGEDRIVSKVIDLINEKTRMSGRNTIFV